MAKAKTDSADQAAAATTNPKATAQGYKEQAVRSYEGPIPFGKKTLYVVEKPQLQFIAANSLEEAEQVAKKYFGPASIAGLAKTKPVRGTMILELMAITKEGLTVAHTNA